MSLLESSVSILNSGLRVMVDLFLLPFRTLSPLVGLVLVSLLTAVVMLVIFKFTSNQVALALVKRRIHAGLFEIRLFNDDLRIILDAQFDILKHNLNYLRLSLIPMLWMILPLFLLIAQLQFHYAYTGLEEGASTLVKVELSSTTPPFDHKPDVTLDVPAGLQVDTAPLWIPSRRQMIWRIRAETQGAFLLTIRAGDSEADKTLHVSTDVARRSPLRTDRSILNQLIYPAESPLPASGPFHSIEITYPERDIQVFGLSLHWMIVFFGLSLIFAFLLRNRFGVTI